MDYSELIVTFIGAWAGGLTAGLVPVTKRMRQIAQTEAHKQVRTHSETCGAYTGPEITGRFILTPK